MGREMLGLNKLGLLGHKNHNFNPNGNADY